MWYPQATHSSDLVSYHHFPPINFLLTLPHCRNTFPQGKFHSYHDPSAPRAPYSVPLTPPHPATYPCFQFTRTLPTMPYCCIPDCSFFSQTTLPSRRAKGVFTIVLPPKHASYTSAPASITSTTQQVPQVPATFPFQPFQQTLR